MCDKKVSIVVPVYNCETYLSDCIKSIIIQTYTNIEILLVNDGSTDSSYNICEIFENLDKRIKVFNQKNSGASVARNVGIDNSTGKYIMFVDADDHIEETMVEVLVAKAESEQADFIICGMTVDFYDKKGRLLTSNDHSLKPRIISENNNIPANILDLVENEKISGPVCKLIKLDVIRKHEIKMPTHISLQEDLFFNIKVLEQIEKVIVVEGCYYHYRKGRDESVTSRYYHNKYEMTNEVHDLLLNFYTEKCDNSNVINRIKYVYIKNTYASFINLFHADCHLSRKAKINYISNIVMSCKYKSMISCAFKPGMKYGVLKAILRTKNVELIYYSSKFIFILKHLFKFKY